MHIWIKLNRSDCVALKIFEENYCRAMIMDTAIELDYMYVSIDSSIQLTSIHVDMAYTLFHFDQHFLIP